MPLLLIEEEKSCDTVKACGAWSGEVMAFCPRCKAFQTVWVSGDKLVPTRKFAQRGGYIYHDCGSSRPCRLYRTL